MKSPRVSVVILNRNRACDLVECLESLFRNTYPDFGVILVDNASEDGSIAFATAWAESRGMVKLDSEEHASVPNRVVWTKVDFDGAGAPDYDEMTASAQVSAGAHLTIIASKSNLGYAGGHNLGITIGLRRGSPFVLLLNSDVTVGPDFLGPLVAEAQAEGVGAAGPLVLDHFHRSVVWQAGARVHAGRGWVEGLGKGLGAETFDNGPRRVDAVVGCAVLLKSDAVRDVGLMDTDYFLYLEETDWFVRASKRGWNVMLVPESRVWHNESRLSAQAKAIHSSYYFARNRLMFVQKNFPGLLPQALIWSLRYGILNNLIRRRWSQLEMAFLGTWDFLMGRKGMRDALSHVSADLPGILVFSVDYKPRPGGIAEHAFRIAEGFRKLGARVAVLGPRYGRYRDFDRSQGFDTYRMPHLPGIDWLLYFFALLYLVVTRKIGLVYCATSHPCALICLAAKAFAFFRYTVTIHAHEVLYSTHGLRQRVKKSLRRLQVRALSDADKVYAVSHFTMQALLDAGVDGERTAAIFNGVDAEDLLRGPARDELIGKLGIAGRRIILTVSRLDVHKGHDTVIRSLPQVLKHVTRAVYVIAGDGPMRATLEALAEDAGVKDQVVFTGQLPRPDIIALYRACDLFVMISRIEAGSAEGFGIAFLEAAVFGKPVVGGRSGGIPDAVADGRTGLLVDPEDPAEVARAITRILVDPDLASRLGRAGYDRVRSEFTWERTLQRILDPLR